MQAGGGFYGARAGGGEPPRAPPSPREQKLMDVLLRAREEHVTTVLKCVGGWPFEEQANLANWRAVLDRLHALLRRALVRCPRLVLVAPELDEEKKEDVKMEVETTGAAENELTEQVYEILRFTALLLENAASKAQYPSTELVVAFLSARNERVAFEATHVAAMLALPPALHRFTIDPSSVSETSASKSVLLRRRLLVVAQGHGALNSNLDVVDYLTAARTSAAAYQYSFQFYGTSGSQTGSEVRAEVITIPIPELTSQSEEADRAGESSLDTDSAYISAKACESLISEFNVPKKLHFQLYTKIRACYSSRSKAAREAIILERMYALLALFTIFGDSTDVINYIEQNAELTRGIVELVRVEVCDKIPNRIRIAALLVLTALVNDRVGRAGGMGVLGRQSNVLSALGVAKGAPHGVFPSLVRFCMSELENATAKSGGSRRNSATAATTPGETTGSSAISPARTSSEADTDMDMSLAVAFVQATTDLLSPEEAEVVGGPAFRNPLGTITEAKLCWVESVLQLLSAVVSIQSGASVLTENGVVPALLHSITIPSVSAFHTTIVTQCVQSLEITVSNHSAAANLYKDLNGVGILTDRLASECASVNVGATTQQQLGEAKGSLIISILAALSMSFHSQGIMSAGATSRVIRDGSVLSKVLFKILSHVDAFSPVVFAQAAMVVSDVINNDPSSVNHIHASGIADVFLQTMTRWNVEELYPSQILRPSSSELLIAVPTVLNALSLTTNHAEKVAKYDPLMHLLDMFALPQYSEDESADCFQGDVASVVGAGIFELMRHVPSTQNSAVQAAVHAIKKIVRFAEEKVGKSQPLVTDEAWQQQYDTLLRMTTHLADLLEPLLSKSEHASYFADLGGVQSLLKLYQLILPSTSSFLSSGQTSAGSNHSQSSMRHHPAAQAITLALRTYASQQPTNLLTTIVKEMNAQLDTLRAARAKIGLPWYLSESGEGAESILCSLPDLDLTTLFNSSADGVKTEAAKVALTGDYLRVLAMIEWLCLVLIWTLDTAHGHLQSRRWFTEFSSKSTQLVLARLFSVDRSVQFERANLAALQQKQKHVVHEGGVSEPKGKATGLWKVGSLLLLRFAIVARNLLSAYGKAFFSASLQHRRSDDASAPLAPHARTLAKTVALTLERHLLYVISESRANQIDAFVQQYYLTFLLETITMVVFEGKKKQVNTLVLLQLLKPIDDKTAEASFNEDVAMTSGEQDILPSTETPVNTVSTGATFTASNLIGIIMNIIQRFFALSFESETADSSGKLSPSRMSLSSFRIAAGLLSRVSNLDVISASPMTAALVADNEMGRSGEAHDKFEPQVLSVELHRLCLRTFLTVWANPKLSDLPTEYIISDVLPVAMTLLKNRIDRDADGRDEPRDSLSGVGDNSVDFFGEALNLRRALFGGGRPTERRTTSRQAFTVDSNIVDNLVSMGFSRRRVEHALRRIQVNDVELAMEWILEHEEEDINTDDIDSSSEVNADGDVQSVTSTQAEDSEQKQHENELHALYAQLRGSFEDTCVQIMLVHGNSIVVAGDSAKTPYPGQQLVKMIAEYFSYLIGQSSAERDTVISKLNTAILECFSESASTPKDERLLTMLVHLLALLLRLNPYARGVYLTQSPSSSDKLLSMVATTSADATGGVSTSLAPTLLVMDALASARSVNGSDPASPELIATTAEDVKMTDDDKDSDNQSGSLEFERKLVKMCLDLLKNSRGTLDQTSAHAVWQLLARVTLKFELASYFYLHGGVDAILSVQDSVFSGYHDLTCAVLSHVLESPEVLEQMMREKISRAMSKLATRFGSPRQMRITPRALLMEVAPVAARNEDVFVRALKHSVEVKKTELGRTYVVPIKEKSDARNAESRATAASTDQPVDDDMAGDKKAPAHHRFPKEYKHHAQAIVEKIIDKIRMLWIEERHGVTDSKKLDTDGASTCVCVGMYLRLLVHLVMQFPLCASILAKARYSHETREPFVRVVLQDFLPCPELCNFAAVRRALKDGGLYGGNDNNSTEADSLISDVGTFVNNRTRSRVRNAHRLLVSIGSQSSEGSKVIILEVVHLLQRWPQRLTVGDAGILGLDVEVSSSSSEPDLSVRDEVALSALHAWAGLIMSILWPKGSSKGFALDKVVLGGGLKGQHSFVTLLADTLRKIDLEHPLAHATCSMLLRPLATLTRPFVTQRIRRLLKKRSEGGEASSTETLEHLATSDQDNAAEGGSSGAGSRQDVGVASIPSHEVAAGHAPEPLIAEDVSDDVAMRSPSSAVEDHEMQEDVDSDGEQSNHSSESGDSIDDRPREEQEEDDIEEDEDDEDDDDEDEDDDDDDEDEDEDDDDEEEDEDEVRMHIRSSRRGDRHASNQRNAGNRLWGSLDSELSVLDALDEVDEEEFSYLNMLDDEAAFAEEQNRRVRRASRQSEEASRGESTVATGVTRSLADALGLRGAAENRLPNSQTQVLTFGNEDGDESDNTTSADASAESGQTLSSRGGSVRELGTSRNSLSASSLLQYIEELPDMGDDVFFFDSLMDELPIPSRGRQDRNSSRGNTVSDGASLHPLLRMDNSDNLLGGDSLRGSSDRLPLPRHSSLLRELQELTEQVQNHMPVSITGSRGGRIGGRDQLSRGGRGRPPSRNNRLSIVSNLLNEFSLNSLQMNSSRGNPLRMRRGDRDIFGAPARGLRGDSGMNATWSWGPGLQNEDLDVRSVASRLEQRITESITDSTEEPATGSTPHPETSSAPIANNDEAVPMSEVESSPQEPNEDVDTDVATPRGSDHTASESSRTSAAANETSVTRGDPSRTTIDLTNSATEAGDTASVVDLTSTFGESSLRSPDESDTDSHLATASVTTLEDTPTAENSSAVPPPAPTTTTSMADPMMGFTLDLSGFNLPPALNATEPQQTQPQEQQQHVNTAGVHEDESKTEEDVSATGDQITTEATAEESAGGFQCPEGMDPEVFDSLPPDVQAEIIAQFEPTPSPAAPQSDAATPSGTEGMSQLEIDMANSSFDRETLEALPPDIRAEVLENERREREAAAAAAAAPADVSRAQEMDNASFVASLAPELREEILITCDDAFLQTLPSQVRAEATVLRERAAFRTTYREPDLGGGPDLMALPHDIFTRPSLRRTQTSAAGGDGGSGSRRRPRTFYHDLYNDRRGRREGERHHHHHSSSHKGMLRVDKDEDEVESDRICDERCVKGLLRLLFMAQSVIQNRVLQRLIANICMYPLTRHSVRTNLLRIVTLPLESPLVPSTDLDDSFPPTHLYGCNGATNRQLTTSNALVVSPDVVSRMLHVLVSLAKYNPRFTIEMLQAHGMRRKLYSVSDAKREDERGVSVLIDLLSVPVVNRNGTNLDTLLELLELVLSPLERLPKSTSTESTESVKVEAPANSDVQVDASVSGASGVSNEGAATSTAEPGAAPESHHHHGGEWVTVPSVELDSKRMQNIVAVLGMDICTPQMQERTLAILKLLNQVTTNRKLVVAAIVGLASELARVDRYKPAFPSASTAYNSVTSMMLHYETSAVLFSAQDELKLLRLLHTLSDICESTAEFTDCCQTIGLDSLWDALSESLEEARSNGGLDDQDVAGTQKKEAATGHSTEDENADGMVIEGKSAGASCAMAALLARFLPMVEAFFVVNARDAASMTLSVPDTSEREEAVVAALRSGGFDSAEANMLSGGDGNAESNTAASSTGSRSLERASSTSSEVGESMRLANFVEANRVLLNILVREKPSLLDSSLAALIKIPRCRAYLDFDNKRTYFHSAMKKLRQTALRSHGGSASVRIPVRRDHIFEDSYYALRMRSGNELRRKLHISFTNEEGIDAGGVTREWYVILAREIFNPNYVLFTSAADSPTFQPNPLSYVNKDHLSYFEFVGKVIGKAVADGQLLDAHFTRSFYKHMLQLPISYHDMEAIDPEYYRNLHSILDHNIEDLGLELTFSAEQSNFGKTEIVDLIPNGRNVAVTDANKMEYVKLVTHHRMATGIRQQIDAFLQGFHQLVPPEMIAIFNENELELLISGMPEIDIDDLKANTEYANYKPTDSVIRWFWNVLYAFTQEERALFLQFVTGTSKVPLEGFKALEGMRGTQKFNIHKAFGNNKALPSAHTCFNQLDLPEYESEEKLKQCLLLAIREGSEGFGFG